jgi:hypothetical protein
MELVLPYVPFWEGEGMGAVDCNKQMKGLLIPVGP